MSSQPINSTGLATTCFATTDHPSGLAVCSLIEEHADEHVDHVLQYAWSEDDSRGGMFLITYLACALFAVAVCGLAWVIRMAVR
ncbi:MAG TPA: hypothetical protein VK638_35830 [Edaphobacter sp.]|nr:hypothetical protein [Edaphobacter sp.]